MSRKRDKVEILLYLITGAFFGFLLSVFAKLPYDANILVAIATLTLVIITLWYAYSTHKLVKQPIDLLLINEIYSPLNTIMISQKDLSIGTKRQTLGQSRILGKSMVLFGQRIYKQVDRRMERSS